MAKNKDIYKYKKHPYFEKPNKKDRVQIEKTFRHLVKIKIKEET